MTIVVVSAHNANRLIEMKNYVWLKHNNIMLINLCVIGLMLWLTISFLVLAISEREQALLLRSSVNTQKTIYSAATVVASESLRIGTGLDVSIVDKEIQKIHRKAVDFSSFCDATNESMLTTTTELISKKKFDLHSRNNASSIATVLSQLNENVKKLDSMQKSALDQYASGGENKLDGVSAYSRLQAIELHQETIMGMNSLSNGIAYLPSNKASDISVLQSIVAELMDLRYELAQSQLNNSYIIKANRLGNESFDFSDRQASTRHLTHLENISLLSSSLDSYPAADEQSQALKSWYLKHDTRIQGNQDNSYVYLHEDPVLFVALLEKVDELADVGFKGLNILGAEQLARATRNFYIDIVLILLCFLVTATTVLLNKRIKYLAYKDNLTGLANRVSLEHWLVESTGSSQTDNNTQHALIYINLDKFKSVNDNYGHELGDELLKEASRRLTSACDSSAIVARLGGDEFAVYLRDITSEEQVMLFSERLIQLLSQEYKVQGHNAHVGASAGVSFYPEDSSNGLKLLNNADIAMYHNKANDQGCADRFNVEVAEYYQHRLETEVDLKKALENDEFELNYQPKVCVTSGQVMGVEALLRWKHHERGYISPAVFIPVAEELGLMEKIGTWVLNKACVETFEHQQKESLDYQLAVNISSQQFRDDKFEAKIYKALKDSGLKHSQLELEVTESLLMHDQDRVITVLHNLRQQGIKTSIDDFGTGYSSLQYLQKLPLDALKIDRAFILALDDISPADSVANSIVQMASLFNLVTVAEGVETAEQDQKIRSLGVNFIQGYRYSRPLPCDELADAIRAIPTMFESSSGKEHNEAA